MTIEELVEFFPKAVGLLMEEGIICIQCGEPVWGTLRDVTGKKGINVDSVIEKLNNLLLSI